MGRYFTLILIMVIGLNLGLAQESYIDHPIKKGESVYMISRLYGVSVKSIFELNPGSEKIIYAGNILRIPKSSNSTSASPPIHTPSDNTVITDNIISN